MGGAQQALLTLARELSKRGYDVDVVLVRAEGEFIDRIPADATIIDLDADRVLSAVNPLRRYLRRNQPEALISTITVTNLVAVWAARLARSNTRVILRESVVFSKHKVSYSPMKRRVIPLLVRLTYRHADAIVGVTHEVRQDIADVVGLDQNELHTVYNDIDVDEILEDATEPIDHPWFESNDTPIVLGAGRLSYQKDFKTLIKAIDEIQDSIPCRLVIIGEGPDREDLEALIVERNLQDVVSLPGYKENPFAYMARSDVFVLSSRWEGTANVLLEAMACGTPVVTTDCGTAEIIGDGERGPVVPIGDERALAEAISKTVADPIDGDLLQQWVRDNCSSMIDGYEEIAQQLLTE